MVDQVNSFFCNAKKQRKIGVNASNFNVVIHLKSETLSEEQAKKTATKM